MLTPLKFLPGMNDLAENLLRSMLEQNPGCHPTAAQLLQHPWSVKHGYGVTAAPVQEHVIIERLHLVNPSYGFGMLDKFVLIVKCLRPVSCYSTLG